MKVYKLPAGVPAPKVDYAKFDHAKMQADEAAHQARVKAWLIAQGYTGKYTGVVVSYPVADGAALYMVADGPKFALIHLPYGDGYQYTGINRFTKADIIKEAERSKAMAKLFAKTPEFWNSRKPGEIVHYDNGGGAYVRGVIVLDGDGKPVMKATALVGDWKDYDLPKWGSTGELVEGYHAKQIRSGETMTPNEGNMWEARPRGKDPRALHPINLTPPPLTPEEIVLKSLTRLRYDVANLLTEGKADAADPAEEARNILREAKAMLERAGV